jgi:hypothetical protein
MKNLISTAIIATAVALLVPNNGAEAVGTTPQQHSFVTVAQVMPAPVSDTQAPAGDTKLAWVMALGFLGLVVSRRIRGE